MRKIPPALAGRGNDIIDPLDPKGAWLLGDTGSGRVRGLVAWDRYAEGLDRALDPSIPRQDFGRADVMLQARIGGLGIGLGRTLLIEDDIRNGLLVPIGAPARIEPSYWLVTAYETAESDAFRALADWLMTMIQKDRGGSS